MLRKTSKVFLDLKKRARKLNLDLKIDHKGIMALRVIGNSTLLYSTHDPVRMGINLRRREIARNLEALLAFLGVPFQDPIVNP